VLYSSFNLQDTYDSPQDNSGTSFWVEMGYILAMKTAFTGMSYLSSSDWKYGPKITGSFDLFMGLAGIANATQKHSALKTTGYFLDTLK